VPKLRATRPRGSACARVRTMTAYSSLQIGRAELAARGARLVQALGGHWSGSSGMCRCPAHDDSSPSLSIRVGESNLLFKCFAGCHVSDVLRAIDRYDFERSQPTLRSNSLREPDAEWVRNRVRELWDEARPIAGSPAEAYLSSRGLAHTGPGLRYHPRTPLKTSDGLITRPAMLAAVVERGGVADQSRRATNSRSG
jgi:putative DNA primase/helicase